jgi:hypothetical protein
MSKIQVEVEVAKEIYEAMVGLAKFGAVVKEALKDGWQMGDDLTPIMASAMADLLPGLQGVDQAKAEFEEDPSSAVMGVIAGAKPLVEALMKKEEEPA